MVVLQDDYQDSYRDLGPLKTLTALSLVNRRFYHLAQSPLCRTILLWGVNDFYFGDRHALHLLLATALANNPRLGLSTREISLAHGNLSIEGALIDLLGDQIGSLNMSSEFIDLLKRDIIFERKGSGVASFLLALMPRVRLVELYFYKEISMSLPYLLGGRLSQNACEPHTVANHLHSLQELRITVALEQTCEYIDYFESILLHPTLRTLKLSGIEWTEERTMDMEWPDYPCNLRELNLDRCIVDASAMREVLSRCTKLEILTIAAGSYDAAGQPHYRKWKVDFYEFGDALRELGQNLVKFELDTYLLITKNNFIGKEDDPNTIALAEALPMSIEVMNFKEDVIDFQMGQEVYGYEKMHDEIHGLAVGAFEYEYCTSMELYMKRRDAGYGGVQNI
ncbi:F-box domain-containing protein [Fusarium sp. Ph1]|nr:F-box domain-containing protein [Fusarium sp. Ph1]